MSRSLCAGSRPSPTLNVPTTVSGMHKHQGAQPHNTNALKHGFYSRHAPNAIKLNMAIAIQHAKDSRAGHIPIHETSISSNNLFASILDAQPTQPKSSKSQLEQEVHQLVQSASIASSLALLEHKRTAASRRLLFLSENTSTLLPFYKVKAREQSSATIANPGAWAPGKKPGLKPIKFPFPDPSLSWGYSEYKLCPQIQEFGGSWPKVPPSFCGKGVELTLIL